MVDIHSHVLPYIDDGARNEDEAIKKAKDNKMFTFEYDYEDIDYIEEIDKEEYEEAIGVIKG